MSHIKRPILIIDYGSQYTQLIARRIREIGVYSVILPHTLSQETFEQYAPYGVILSGGPASTSEHGSPRIPAWLFAKTLPILGICYGMQAMTMQEGGVVSPSTLREYGHARLSFETGNPLFSHLDSAVMNARALDVWMSHGDKVLELAPGYVGIAHTSNTPFAAMMHQSKPWFGLQFHPEVTHTECGLDMLKNFVLGVCQATQDWTSEEIISESVERIQEQVGDAKVLLGLSGGVDSSVVAALLNKAIPGQVLAVFVDTGLLRKNEAEEVSAMFGAMKGISFLRVDAKTRFYDALKGIACPEAKRKTIGRVFIEVFQEEAEKHPNLRFLAQGTIYPDVIESAAVENGGVSHVIKSHHNVGGLPDTLKLALLEPLRMLFKDEVRGLGLKLGLPAEMIYRHPFPGPGLGVRILGEVFPEAAEILRNADAIFIEELRKADLYNQVSQAFAVFLPVKSVGVMGDGRRYDYVICLRAVQTVDFMTAHWAELPWAFLGQVSNRIINEVPGVSRVTYDISGKPPATIEWE